MDTLSSNTIRDSCNERSLDEVFRMYGIQREGSEKQDDNNSISSDNSETLNERLKSELFIVRAVEGKILSQFPIDDSESIAGHVVESNTRSRASCLGFRSMLQPISKDKVPARDEVWLRKCMRGILASAIIGGTYAQELCPEHVYCWFTENHSIKPDDEELWSFYYGLKRLIAANHDAEAWLHYQILNDINLDFPEFFVDTVVFTKSLMDQSWLADLGVEECQQQVLIPKDVTNLVISRMFNWTEPPFSGLSSEPDEESGRVDLFSFLQLLMKEHTDLIKKQTTLLRVLFDTARPDDGAPIHFEKLVRFRELHQILKAIHEPITLNETTQLYRDAYDVLVAKATSGYAPRGITFDSFLFAAKRRGLFTQIRRKRQNCKEN